MLSCCATVGFPSTLKLTLGHVNHQDSTVGLCCAGDHVCNKITMTWGIKNCKIAVRSWEISCGDLYRDTSLLLFFCFVHNVGILKPCFTVDFSLALVGPHLLIGNDAVFMEYFARKRTFSTIHVADDNQVQILLFLLTSHDQLPVQSILYIGISLVESRFIDNYLNWVVIPLSFLKLFLTF